MNKRAKSYHAAYCTGRVSVFTEIAAHNNKAWEEYKKSPPCRQLIKTLEDAGIKYNYCENIIWHAFHAGVNAQFKNP